MFPVRTGRACGSTGVHQGAVVRRPWFLSGYFWVPVLVSQESVVSGRVWSSFRAELGSTEAEGSSDLCGGVIKGTRSCCHLCPYTSGGATGGCQLARDGDNEPLSPPPLGPSVHL